MALVIVGGMQSENVSGSAYYSNGHIRFLLENSALHMYIYLIVC